MLSNGGISPLRIPGLFGREARKQISLTLTPSTFRCILEGAPDSLFLPCEAWPRSTVPAIGLCNRLIYGYAAADLALTEQLSVQFVTADAPTMRRLEHVAQPAGLCYGGTTPRLGVQRAEPMPASWRLPCRRVSQKS